MSSIVGINGLEPTLNAKYTTVIAIANKDQLFALGT